MNETRLKRAFARTVLPTTARLVQAVTGARRVDGNTLDPQIALMLRLAELMGEPRTHEQPVPVARRTFRHQVGIVDLPLLTEVHTEDRAIDISGVSIPLRIYRPPTLERVLPALVFFHGGGFVIGDLLSHDPVCRWLAREARAVVIAVDYRLAPEHRFPAAVDDCLAAYRWVSEHRDELRVGAVGVGGDSAGGCLAAVVCQQAQRLGLAQPALQFLIYPTTQTNSQHPSRTTFASGLLLEKDTIAWFINHYLPDPSEHADPRASPLLAESVAGLAPTLMVTAGFDPLRDEGRAYADRLQEAGVPVEYHCATGLPHGFWSMGGAIDDARSWVLRLSRRAGELLRESRP